MSSDGKPNERKNEREKEREKERQRERKKKVGSLAVDFACTEAVIDPNYWVNMMG